MCNPKRFLFAPELYRKLPLPNLLIIYNAHIFKMWWFENTSANSLSLFPFRRRISLGLVGFCGLSTNRVWNCCVACWNSYPQSLQQPGKWSDCLEATMLWGSSNQSTWENQWRDPETLGTDREAWPAPRFAASWCLGFSYSLTATTEETLSQNWAAKPFLNSHLKETVRSNKMLLF